MSGSGFLGGLGKRLLQAAAQRVAAAVEEAERKQLPSKTAPAPTVPNPIQTDTIEPVRLDAALARLRADRPADNAAPPEEKH